MHMPNTFVQLQIKWRANTITICFKTRLPPPFRNVMELILVQCVWKSLWNQAVITKTMMIRRGGHRCKWLKKLTNNWFLIYLTITQTTFDLPFVSFHFCRFLCNQFLLWHSLNSRRERASRYCTLLALPSLEHSLTWPLSSLSRLKRYFFLQFQFALGVLKFASKMFCFSPLTSLHWLQHALSSTSNFYSKCRQSCRILLLLHHLLDYFSLVPLAAFTTFALQKPFSKTIGATKLFLWVQLDACTEGWVVRW